MCQLHSCAVLVGGTFPWHFLRVTLPVTWNLSRAPVTNTRFFVTGASFSQAPPKEMSREGAAGRPGGPVPDRRWLEMTAIVPGMGYRVACTVSASYGQGLGEAGQIRGADRGTSAVPGRLSRDPLAGPI